MQGRGFQRPCDQIEIEDGPHGRRSVLLVCALESGHWEPHMFQASATAERVHVGYGATNERVRKLLAAIADAHLLDRSPDGREDA